MVFQPAVKNIRAKNIALPKIKKLVDFSWRDYTEAYNLEEETVKYIPDNPELAELIARTTRKIDMNTDPPGTRYFSSRIINCLQNGNMPAQPL